MRKTLALLAVPAMLLGTVAADPVQLVPCAEDSKVEVVGDGETFEYTSMGEDSVTFRIDPTTDERGRVNATVTLTWDIPVNDYDLDVNGETSIGLQPVNEAREQVTVSASGRCKTVTASWAPFLVATPDNLTLTVTVN